MPRACIAALAIRPFIPCSTVAMRTYRLSIATTVLTGACALTLSVATPLRAQASSRADSAAQSASLPSVALPPELARVLRDYERAWRARDARAIAALFSPDGFALPSGQPPRRGREAIEAAYTGHGGPLVLRAFAFALGDSLAYIVGAYGYETPGTTADASVARTVPDLGKFTLVLRRERGGGERWLIASDMDNMSRRP